jgi:Cdc6-like AAA superfamily ATPase
VTSPDLFGLERERKILESRVREVFTPHRPISSVDLFFGRQTEVAKLIEQINTPGQHALLYGDRGVGKSSLANIASQLVLRVLAGGKLFVKRCDSSTTFPDIVSDALLEAGVDLRLAEETKVVSAEGRAGIKIPIAEAGVSSHRETTTTFRGRGSDISASDAAKCLQQVKGLLMVDEADAIRKKEDKQKLAELIKLLSDASAPFKILVVGIAQTGEDLTGGHPSVERCLKETKLARMSEQELAKIVTGGAEKVKLTFTPNAVAAIVHVSRGYPHFTHLLALKSAEDAIASDRTIVDKEHLAGAVERAISDAEGTLRRVFNSAVRSFATPMYKTILQAAATIPTPEFTAAELRRAMEKLTGQAVAQGALNNYLTRLVSEGAATVLRRMAKGVYAFNDPRMPSFIRLACGMLD